MEDNNRFDIGDLVEYYVFTTYYYGEGSVRLRGKGIVANMRRKESSLLARTQSYVK